MRSDGKKNIEKIIALLLALCFLLALIWTTLPIYMVKGLCALFMLKFLFEAID